MKVAIIHYWMITRRGGEKVVESILGLFPNADVYTMFYDDNGACAPFLTNYATYTSKFNYRFLRKHYQKLFPLFPEIMKSLKLRKKYDLIISSESGPAKGIELGAANFDTPHLCYVHTPMRYCWEPEQYLVKLPRPVRPFVKIALERLRSWDIRTAKNVTHFVANSKNVQNKVKRNYNRKANVVYPPISMELFKDKPLVHPPHKRTHYLSFGAITPYKRIDLLIDAFNENGKSLVVIGDGGECRKLERKANDNVNFLGQATWETIEENVLSAKALLFPGEEDFGMIPLEVMAYGLPVIAYARGGALETVIENDDLSHSTGSFFYEQTVDSLQAAIDLFEERITSFDPIWIRSHARRFGEDRFKEEFVKEVKKAMTPELIENGYAN